MKAVLAPAIHRSTAVASAEIEFDLVAGQSVVTRWQATSPLKLLVPRQRDLSAWVIAATYGGGLLAGDRVAIRATAKANSRGMIGTQSSTKIYRSGNEQVARQTLDAVIEPNALLAVLPEPVVCFANARYEQRQRFDVAEGGSLLSLDWFTCGRLAHGERWAMSRYHTATDIFIAGRRLVHDAMQLDSAAGEIASPFRTGRFNCFASLFAIGPMLAHPAAGWIESINARPLERNGDLLLTASPLAGGAVIRAAGVNIEQVIHTVRGWLRAIAPLLGEDPWSRKW